MLIESAFTRDPWIKTSLNWIALGLKKGEAKGLMPDAGETCGYNPLCEEKEKLDLIRTRLKSKIEAKFQSRLCMRNRVFNNHL